MKRAGVTKITSSCQKWNLTKLNCYLVKRCTGVIRIVLKILFQMFLPAGQARNQYNGNATFPEKIIISIN